MSQRSFDLFGSRVQIRADFQGFESVLGQLRSFIPRLMDEREPDLAISFVDDPPYYVIYVGNTAIADTIYLWEALRWIERILDQLVLQYVRDFALFHAAALVIDGGTILLPGNSGSGKSTLALGLVERGYGYLSDEIAALDLTGALVQPFAKPITIKDRTPFPQFADRWFGAADGERYRQLAPVWYLHPDDVRLQAVAAPAPPCCIVLPTYNPLASPALERVKPAEVVTRLFQHAVNWSSTGFPLVMKLARQIPCYTLTTPDLNSAFDLLESTVHSLR